METNRIRVLLVEDHPLTGEHVHAFLSSFPNIDVVGRAQDGQEAVLKAVTLKPNVVVMDVNLPKMDGIAATREIKTRNPESIVVGLTVRAEDYLVYTMLKAGAFEVVLKDKLATDLYSAIQRAVAAVHPIVIQEATTHHPEATSPLSKSNLLLSSASTSEGTNTERQGLNDTP
jgi:DNA-binding NarL/FixJ family response regulator